MTQLERELRESLRTQEKMFKEQLKIQERVCVDELKSQGITYEKALNRITDIFHEKIEASVQSEIARQLPIVLRNLRNKLAKLEKELERSDSGNALERELRALGKQQKDLSESVENLAQQLRNLRAELNLD